MRMLAEALQLGMVNVPARFTTQHGLGQQRLSPQRDEADGVQVPGMQRPESHGLAPEGAGWVAARRARVWLHILRAAPSQRCQYYSGVLPNSRPRRSAISGLTG